VSQAVDIPVIKIDPMAETLSVAVGRGRGATLPTSSIYSATDRAKAESQQEVAVRRTSSKAPSIF
jgi:hypothetical protein